MAVIGYICRFCGAGGGDHESPNLRMYFLCHVCKAPEAMIPRRMFEQLQELYKQRDEAKEQLAQLQWVLTPKVVDLIRCGIGSNYSSGKNFDLAMEQYHAPLVAVLNGIDSPEVVRNGLSEKQIAIIRQELIPLITRDITPLLGKVVEKRLNVFAHEIIGQWGTK